MTNATNGFSAWLIGVFEDLRDALTFEQALHVILERLKTILAYQSAAMLLMDGDTNQLHIRNARQISYSFVKKFARDLQGAVLSRVLLKLETIALEDLAPTSAAYQEVRLEHEFTTACLAPVIYRQRAVGYVHCDRAAGPAFSVTEQQRLQAIGALIGLLLEKFELQELSRHLDRVDEPSSALKYLAFLEEYYRELARAKAFNLPLSLLLVDIDEYTHFVATCGISAGHMLLNEVRRLIAEKIRPMDLVGRFSADQFIVCLSGMGRATAAETLQAIRQHIQEHAGRSAGCSVTVSGVALAFERPEDLEVPLAKVLAALNSGLITAQARGRDHVMVVDPPRST